MDCRDLEQMFWDRLGLVPADSQLTTDNINTPENQMQQAARFRELALATQALMDAKEFEPLRISNRLAILDPRSTSRPSLR
jgi:hypothetical protein